MKTSRRKFLEHSLIGIGGLTILNSCATITKTISTPTPTSNEMILNISDEPDLRKPGGYVKKDVEGFERQLVVERFDNNQFRAVHLQCKHTGCQVDDPANGQFSCPCHGSAFDATMNSYGVRISGPTRTGLDTFPATFNEEANTVTVKLK